MTIRIPFFAIAVAVGLFCSPASAATPEAPPGENVSALTEKSLNVTRPDLVFEETRQTTSKYHKYFYFHRENTAFAAAYSDIQECDLRARGLWQAEAVYGLPKERAVDPSGTFLATVASPLVSELVAAFAAPADARRERRFGLRRCMFFKGYSRYGLSRELFDRFNYEATDDELTDEERQSMLLQQAMVASAERPDADSLGL